MSILGQSHLVIGNKNTRKSPLEIQGIQSTAMEKAMMLILKAKLISTKLLVLNV